MSNALAASEDMIADPGFIFFVCWKTAPTTDFPLDIFFIRTLSGVSTSGCETQLPPSVWPPSQITAAYMSKISGFSSKVTFSVFLAEFDLLVKGPHPAIVKTKLNTNKNFPISFILKNKMHSDRN